MINQNILRLNDFIYDVTRYAPKIHFEETRTGKPSYKFGCAWNTDTGENYKNLIIFDLSILNNTDLPYLMHDSLIFKNIADLPIDKIMQLYVQSKKQIFIFFDKKEAFTDFTEKTVTDTTVIELYMMTAGNFSDGFGQRKRRNPRQSSRISLCVMEANKMRISYSPLWKMLIDKGMNKAYVKIAASVQRSLPSSAKHHDGCFTSHLRGPRLHH